MIQAGVVDTRRSPFARLWSLPARNVRFGDGFWRPWRARNRERSIPDLLRMLEEHGVLDNFRRVSGRKDVERRGYYWTDSDLYKWIEAVGFELQRDPASPLGALLEPVIDDVLAAQGPDGYLNTFFVDRDKDERFTRMNASHEFYCLGHLMQAAIAVERANGDARLTQAVRRFADYLWTVFGPGGREEKSDHPELELALIELYRHTGERRYLDFAGRLLDLLQFADDQEIQGHAVCTTYALCAAADYVMETGDERYAETLERLWQDMVDSKIYLTGGIGARYFYEDFGYRYELPNLWAYAETCAAIGCFMWNWRMLLLTGEARFADLAERILYNGFLAGVGHDGLTYFYQNPLASTGNYTRQAWHECTCCPPNVQRLLASLGGYMATTSSGGVWLHFYDAMDVRYTTLCDNAVRLRVETRYPWEGLVRVTVFPDAEERFALRLRVPGHSRGATLRLNGEDVEVEAVPGTYVELIRRWELGDTVELDLDLRPQLVRADVRARDNAACMAVMRGPLVYCAEATDNERLEPLAAALEVNPRRPGENLRLRRRVDLLDGVTTIETVGRPWPHARDGGPLYQPLRQPLETAAPEPLTLIPYFAWANRGPASMAVWLPALFTPTAVW